MKNDYYIEIDTLYGKGTVGFDWEVQRDMKIALSDIEYIHSRHYNVLASILLVFGSVVISLAAVLSIYLIISPPTSGK